MISQTEWRDSTVLTLTFNGNCTLTKLSSIYCKKTNTFFLPLYNIFSLLPSFFQKREYRARSVSLEQAALRGLLWDPDDQSDEYEFAPCDLGLLVPLISLARAVTGMHEKGWIHRDLRADNILIDCNDGQAGFLLIIHPVASHPHPASCQCCAEVVAL